MWCVVDVAGGSHQAVDLDPKANGQECLEKVLKALGIVCEMEYFGLEPWTPNQKESRTRQWYNLRNRLHGDSVSSSNSGIPFTLALRVKFWVPVHTILQENVRNLFYMQAKRDLLEARLCAHDWSNAAKLAALLCQTDKLRFNEQSLRAECPLRMRRELAQQQLQQQQQKLEQQRKEKEHVLSLKKRRLSKQKSVEHIECCTLTATTAGNNQLQLSVSTSATTSGCSSSSSSSPSSSHSGLDERLASNPLRVYEKYVILISPESEPPVDFLRQIAMEHSKLTKLAMLPKTAQYWLLHEIQELNGYGEEFFSGVTTNESATRCDIAVGAHGITVLRGEEKESIPFSAIAAAKSLKRTFKLEYVDDHNDRKELEIKLPKQPIASGLYRSITERHAFYVCDKVRCVVTNQFTRDLKGTIASMFKEDTELGKRYVFDIQHTRREVHDQARRKLHERDGYVAALAASDDASSSSCELQDIDALLGAGVGAGVGVGLGGATGSAAAAGVSSMAGKIDLAIRDKEAREAAIERCVDTRISEAMQCKICMDRAINTVFNPCCHVLACAQCAARCSNCPNCRVKISSVGKIYLPPELRTCHNVASSNSSSSSSSSNSSSSIQAQQQLQSTEHSDNNPSTSTNTNTNTTTTTTTSATATLNTTTAPPGVQPKVTTAA